MFRFSSTLLALLLMGTLLVGQCTCCAVVSTAPDAPHDCCKRSESGDCGTPASQQPVERKCPHQSFALENYTKVELDTARLLEFFPAIASPEVPAEPETVVSALGDLPLVHAPPDLYLLNSILLI